MKKFLAFAFSIFLLCSCVIQHNHSSKKVLSKRKYRSGFHFRGFAKSNSHKTFKDQKESVALEKQALFPSNVKNKLSDSYGDENSKIQIQDNLSLGSKNQNLKTEYDESKEGLIDQKTLKKVSFLKKAGRTKKAELEEDVENQLPTNEIDDIELEKKKLKHLTTFAIISSALSLFPIIGWFIFFPIAVLLWVLRRFKKRKINQIQSDLDSKPTEEQLKERNKSKESKKLKNEAGGLLALRIATAIIGSMVLTFSIMTTASGYQEGGEGIVGIVIGALILLLSGILRSKRHRKLREIKAKEEVSKEI